MITILESTNVFDSTTQTYESIMTGDLSDSKIVFQSDQLDTLTNLSFKVQLYFDEVLIFETETPVLYEDGVNGISNVDLSAPIRTYMATQIGMSKYDDDIETQYNNFRKINNSGKVVITELSSSIISESTILALDNLLLWYDTDTGITLDSDDTVESWEDRVSSKMLVMQNIDFANGSYTDINGKFLNWHRGTANSYLITTEIFDMIGADDEFTIFSVSQYVSGVTKVYSRTTASTTSKIRANSDGYFYITNGTDTFEDDQNYTVESPLISVFYQGPTTGIVGIESYDFDNDYEYSNANTHITFDDSDSRLYMVGDAVAGTPVSTDESLVGDLIVFDGLLDSNDRDKVIQYLNYKYNIESEPLELDTYIYKTVEKDTFVKPVNTDTVFDYNLDDLLLNRYFDRDYSPNVNSIDTSNNTYYNTIYRSSDLLLNFYLDTTSGTTFTYIKNNDLSLRIYIKTGAVFSDSVTLNINEEKRFVHIYSSTALSWSIIIDGVYTSGTDFDVLNSMIDALGDTYQFDTVTLYPFINSKASYKEFVYTDDCEKYPHQLRWLNMLGGYDTFNFDLIHQESLQIKDKGYYQNNYGLTDSITTNNFKSSYKSYDKKFNKKYTFKTDWLTDDQIYLLEDLFKSTEIYYLFDKYSDGKSLEWLAMKNLTKSKTLYHKDIKGLKKYEITIEESIKKEII